MTACSNEKAACAAEPACASWLDCVLACPVATNGDADPVCEKACPGSSTEDKPRAALNDCRRSGAGASCTPCGKIGPGAHPILNQSCPASTSADGCVRCQESKCCKTSCDAGCNSLIGCIKGCGGLSKGDTACIDACYAKNPKGVAETGPWLACVGVVCKKDCPGILTTTDCAACALEKCGAPFADCLAEPACYLRYMCGLACKNTECYQACDKKHIAGEAAFDRFLLCVADRCAGSGPCASEL
jgi:hypothetical protein